MRRTLIALAMLGVFTGAAYAQSNVMIYGIADTGFIKRSGQDMTMGSNVDSRIGFRGTEDLGSGLKATFELEKRFYLNNGSNMNREYDLSGASNVGLKSDVWGAVRLGRVNELTTETIRKFDPFYQYGVGAMLIGSQRMERINNTIRYDSPKWQGFHFGASYSLGGNTNKESIEGQYDPATGDGNGMRNVKANGADNDGYGIMIGYDNGPWNFVGNWSRLADSKESSVWNLGAAYHWGPAKIELLYQQTKDKGWAEGKRSGWNTVGGAFSGWGAALPGNLLAPYAGTKEIQEKQWLLGLEWKMGPGRINASAQWMEVEALGSAASDKDVHKYAIGYVYDLSKRTSIYGTWAYTDYDDRVIAHLYGDKDDGTSAVQFGITHRF